MPTDQSEAIVLRTTNVGDQDKIAVLFCRDKGVVRGVAKGARKFGNRFGSSLEPMSVVRVFYYEMEHRDLVTISNCDLLESFFEVQSEPKTAFLATYFAELVEEFAPARAKEDILYRLLLAVLRCLKEGGDRTFLAAYFEAWILQINGYLPDLGTCRKCRKPLRPGWLGPKRDGAYCAECAPLKKEEVPAGSPGLPPLGPGEPAGSNVHPAPGRGRTRAGPENSPGPHRLPPGARTKDVALPEVLVLRPLCRPHPLIRERTCARARWGRLERRSSAAWPRSSFGTIRRTGKCRSGAGGSYNYRWGIRFRSGGNGSNGIPGGRPRSCPRRT